jgi:hypothetical protein
LVKSIKSSRTLTWRWLSLLRRHHGGLAVGWLDRNGLLEGDVWRTLIL